MEEYATPDPILLSSTKKFFHYYRSRENCHGEFSLSEVIKTSNKVRKKAWTNKQGLTVKDIEDHLCFRKSLGGHIQRLDNTCSRISFDIDEGETKRITLELCQILEEMNFIPFPSYSGGLTMEGEKKYHIDVFFNSPLSWNETYYLGLFIKNKINDRIEVFPKQGEGTSYGNWLKFPLGVHPLTKHVCHFLDWKKDLTPILPRETAIDLLEESDVFSLELDDIIESVKLQQSLRREMGTKMKEKSWSEPKTNYDEKTLDEVISKMRLCFRIAYLEKWPLLGSEGHQFRVAAAIELEAVAPNIPSDLLAEYFKSTPDFDLGISMYYIKKIRSKQYLQYNCLTIKERCGNILGTICDGCSHNKQEDKGFPPILEKDHPRYPANLVNEYIELKEFKLDLEDRMKYIREKIINYLEDRNLDSIEGDTYWLELRLDEGFQTPFMAKSHSVSKIQFEKLLKEKGLWEAVSYFSYQKFSKMAIKEKLDEDEDFGPFLIPMKSKKLWKHKIEKKDVK